MSDADVIFWFIEIFCLLFVIIFGGMIVYYSKEKFNTAFWLIIILLVTLSIGFTLGGKIAFGQFFTCLDEEIVYTVKENIGNEFYLLDTDPGKTRVYNLPLPDSIKKGDKIIYKKGKFYKYFPARKATLSPIPLPIIHR